MLERVIRDIDIYVSSKSVLGNRVPIENSIMSRVSFVSKTKKEERKRDKRDRERENYRGNQEKLEKS